MPGGNGDHAEFERP